MTGKSLEVLSLSLLEQELKSNRYNKSYAENLMKYAAVFIDWVKACGYSSLISMRRKDIVLYQSWLGTRTNKRTGKLLASSTLEHYYEAVKKVYSVLYRAGAVTENITHGLEFHLPGEKRAFKRRPMSREEITTLLESIPVGTVRGLRNRAFFELIYSSGLRISEATGLKAGNIDFNQRQLLVRGKYDRDRIVPFSDVAKDFLLKFLGARKDAVDEYVFTGTGAGPVHRTQMSRIFRELLAKCGMDNKELCVHSIRHSTATHLLDNGAGVRHVQELLGHKSIESTVLYTHVQTEGLARVYRKYHPRQHELFEMMDASYEKRLEGILFDKYGRLLTGEKLGRPAWWKKD